MKRKDIVEGRVVDVKFPNKGYILVDDKKVMVKNTIKGQKVKARITRNRANRKEAKLIEVLERSPNEIQALCPHDELCGGCSYQTLAYEQQLELKEKQVKDLLDKLNIDFKFNKIVASPSITGYRNKMEYSFGDEYKGGELSLGMHKRNAYYDIITVDHCKIVDEDYNTLLTAILEYFKEKDIPYYRKNVHEGVLRHLVIRKAKKTKQILINLVTSSQQELDLSELVEKLLSLHLDGCITSFLHTINDGLADVVKSDSTKVLYGKDYFIEELLGLKFKITAFSFFQTNSLGAERLYGVVRDFANSDNDKVVFDLYCGTGTIAQIMAPKAKKVVGIEIVEEAVEAAKENASINGLKNCDFIAGDVLKEVDNLKDNPDIIILDPPREGIHPKAIQKIIEFGAKEVIYVSCKPTSLVNDLEVLINSGYEVKEIQCVDMFPFTAHVETVSKLVKK